MIRRGRWWFGNTIQGGNAGAADKPGGRSYGLYIDWECYPLIVSNTINGGTAQGKKNATTLKVFEHAAGAAISTGVYFINNGRASLRHNTVNGGTATHESRSLYSAYGTNFYLRSNNFSNGSAEKLYGIYLGTNGRVRLLLNNGFTNVGAGFQYRYLDDLTLASVADLNSHYNTETNKDSAIAITKPDAPGKQEWER
jgi:hypothetical protein